MIEAGQTFDVDWLVKAKKGDEYYITGYWTRVLVADTKRISDAPPLNPKLVVDSLNDVLGNDITIDNSQ